MWVKKLNRNLDKTEALIGELKAKSSYRDSILPVFVGIIIVSLKTQEHNMVALLDSVLNLVP